MNAPEDTGTMSHPIATGTPRENVTAAAATALVAAAMRHCVQARVPGSVAVVDAAGMLMAFARADDARFATADLAIDKAWTAASLGCSTGFLADRLDHPRVAALAGRPRFVALPGGFPLLVQGRVIGAVAVSGGSDEQDVAVATAAMSALGFDPAR